MHASIWRFAGEPDELAERYEELAAQIPVEVMVLHACLRTPDGLAVVDTCPSAEAFRATEPRLRSAMAAAGLPEPVVEDFPVQAAFAAGRRVD